MYDTTYCNICYTLGYMGECGLRGGYAEFINIDPDVYRMYLKMLSAKLCPTTLGQVSDWSYCLSGPESI